MVVVVVAVVVVAVVAKEASLGGDLFYLVNP